MIGHTEVLAGLRRAAAADRLPHAMLFSGPAGVGKRTAALELARTLLADDADASDDRIPRLAHESLVVYSDVAAPVPVRRRDLAGKDIARDGSLGSVRRAAIGRLDRRLRSDRERARPRRDRFAASRPGPLSRPAQHSVRRCLGEGAGRARPHEEGGAQDDRDRAASLRTGNLAGSVSSQSRHRAHQRPRGRRALSHDRRASLGVVGRRAAHRRDRRRAPHDRRSGERALEDAGGAARQGRWSFS